MCDDDIDDVELFHEAVKEILPDSVLSVSHTGRQLLSALRNSRPEVIFLDINMPEMNGWECLKVLKGDAALKYIPVIVYTTSSSLRDIEIARDLGAFRLVTKPDRFQDLRKILITIIAEIKSFLSGEG